MTADSTPGAALVDLLALLVRAGRTHGVTYTLTPDDAKPPAVTVGLANSAELNVFVTAVHTLAAAMPAAHADHMALVLGELLDRALARWTDPRAGDDRWYHSRAAHRALGMASGQ
ncbi:MAG TPA: hypothetical protein VLL76_05855, partial [Candidatus Omnitrophota bacterium]|nr:hypothetical protein [Candidatus Omnitrophota bacterium]